MLLFHFVFYFFYLFRVFFIPTNKLFQPRGIENSNKFFFHNFFIFPFHKFVRFQRMQTCICSCAIYFKPKSHFKICLLRINVSSEAITKHLKTRKSCQKSWNSAIHFHLVHLQNCSLHTFCTYFLENYYFEFWLNLCLHFKYYICIRNIREASDINLGKADALHK